MPLGGSTWKFDIRDFNGYIELTLCDYKHSRKSLCFAFCYIIVPFDSMAFVFNVVDPRGKSVSCSEEYWKKHIVGARFWMDGWQDKVSAAVQSPDAIFRDADYSDRECYYQLDKNKRKYMKVVVGFDKKDDGIIITAFPTDSIKIGENLIWARS